MSDAPPRPRVHYIWDPIVRCPRQGLMRWLGPTSLGVGIGLAVGGVGSAGAILYLNGHWTWAVTLGAIALGLAIAAAVLASWFNANLVRDRLRRLRRALDHPQASLRLPHRVWELQLNDSNARFTPSARLTLALRLPLGHTIVVNNTQPAKRVSPLLLPFEPLRLKRDARQLAELAEADVTDARTGCNEATPGRVRPLRSTEGGGPVGRFSANLWGWRLAGVFWLAAFGYIGFFFVTSSRTGAWAEWPLLTIAALAAVVVVQAYLHRTQWWLAPGTLIYRRSRPWWWKARVGWARAESSTLVLHCATGTACLAAGGVAWGFTFARFSYRGLLAGWLSTARRPTPEEIMSFLGPDVEVDAELAPSAEDEGAPP